MYKPNEPEDFVNELLRMCYCGIIRADRVGEMVKMYSKAYLETTTSQILCSNSEPVKRFEKKVMRMWNEQVDSN